MFAKTINYDGFAAYLAREGRRNSTIKKHLNCLHYLERSAVSLEKTHLETFLVSLKQQGKSGAYLNLFVGAVSQYGKFLGINLKIKEFKVDSAVKGTLSDSEIERFLALPLRHQEPKTHYVRFKMFWQIVAFTGMRPGEVAVLQPKHFDFGRGVIIIETSKTNQPGQVPIPVNIKADIESYLNQLQTAYLFPSARGGASYQCGVAVVDNVAWHFDWLKRLQALGINRRPGLTPYSFRHSYATRLLEEEVSLFHVKKLMRHNDLKSTLVYEHLTTKDLIKAQQKLPLIRKSTQPKEILRSMTEVIKNFHIEEDGRFKYELIEDGESVRFECRLVEQKIE